MLPFVTEETLLKVEGLSKRYDVPILRDINIEIKNIKRPDVTQGQIVSLVGKSGSGKSTLFRLLAGLEKPDEGTIKVCSGICTAAEPTGEMRPVVEGQMGVVFQNSYVYPWRKVSSLLHMAAERHDGIDPEEAVKNYADLFSLTDHMNKYSSQLSGGQRQRVAIAEQVLNGGEFILMDEPFSGLDTLTIDRVTETITRIAQTDERKTIIIVSHDLSNCMAISDTAFILAKQEGAEGATITHRVDLATQGLAWQPDIKDNPLFRDLLKQVKSLL